MGAPGEAIREAIRDHAGGYLRTWRRARRLGRIALLLGGLVGLGLLGAFLFGAWHVVVGGLVKGNPRAAGFGIGLAAVSALALVALALVGGRATGPIDEAPASER